MLYAYNRHKYTMYREACMSTLLHFPFLPIIIFHNSHRTNEEVKRNNNKKPIEKRNGKNLLDG